MPTTSGTDAWVFDLPDAQIARHPVAVRSASRLLVVPREGGALVHRAFRDLPDLLRAGDLVVANDSRVQAARLFGRRPSGGRVELLVLDTAEQQIRALARPARKIRVDERLILTNGTIAKVLAHEGDGVLRLDLDRPPIEVMDEIGEIPLPPYLARPAIEADRDRYQTVYARALGSSAAPTAGLHVDADVLAAFSARGIGFTTVTLHVGLGTFRPLSDADLAAGRLHEERYEIAPSAIAAIAETRRAGGRVIALGTTTTRALESAIPTGGTIPAAGAGVTRLFLRPPDPVRSIDGLVTNFHLPRSSLLMLVACLVGRERLLEAYAEAVRTGYRFFSYGDAMLLL